MTYQSLYTIKETTFNSELYDPKIIPDSYHPNQLTDPHGNFTVILKSIFTRMAYTLCIYTAVIILFFVYMYVLFYFTILPDHPRITGYSNLLQLNPGIAIVPNPSVRTTLVHVRVSDPVSYSSMVDEMTALLTHYQTHTAGGMFTACEKKRGYVHFRRVCRYSLDAGGPCNLKNGFGFFRGQPCFVVKLNRIYGWLPDISTNVTGVQVKCEGLTETDAAYLGKVCYYDMDSLQRHDGLHRDAEWCDRDYGIFNQMYYPFLNQGHYQSPIVFVQFRNPKRYVVIWIKCYAIAKNVHVNLEQNEGSMVFQLLVD
ncbi:Sodium/potassium-transporting ATPase subunit beta-2 [Clonorchis sinensis]|uniref:Sodium/potassium-transporting ATPase subunit beta-1 n=2 Tax=Clonorchis sinensis TaxID=79923 RepID=H2KQR5_CLOSI|nr:Sodium/potassium-transporting ATPase subunit beta-2 [Clonorchis sinensis]GAA36767.2 sodium/potassium-transporting ATPase subunit beta-1 [Clonorchis sinensis]